MSSHSRRISGFILIATACAFLAGCQGLKAPVQPTQNINNSVNHIIFMAQENRGFDHYFGHLPQYLAANGFSQTVDGTPATASNPNADGTGVVTPFHMVSQCIESISPFWNESHRDFNYFDPTSDEAKLDGFVRVAAKNAIDSGLSDIEGRRAMAYYDETDLPFYYFMAANFATSDKWFSPVMSRTQPNRMYMVAGTSAGHVYPLQNGEPPLDIPTIFDKLQAAGVSWKIYVTDDTENPLSNGSALHDFTAAAKYPSNFVPASQFLKDANAGTLPQVAMIEPGYLSGLDEHPEPLPGQPGGGVQIGSSYVAGLISGFMQSPAWKDSIFILTWDEAGAFYDHIAPQPTVSPDGIPPSDLIATDWCFEITTGSCDFTFTGFRVPLIVISPFTKKNYVSHTPADYTAILKLIEARFNVTSLTKRDAAQVDSSGNPMMLEFFDFEGVPWKTPPPVPTQPNNEPCTLDLPPA